MANFNKVVLLGRLTRDSETRSFASGGKVAKFGFAVSNRKKDASGQWVDSPCFIDVEVFNRGEFGKLADLVQDRCRKGSQILIVGRLELDQWEDKNGGGKRSKHKVVAEEIQLLDPKVEGGPQQRPAPVQQHHAGEPGSGDSSEFDEGSGNIPF